MNKFFLLAASATAMASSANAQDVAPVAPASPFAGPYVGVQVGYANLEDVHDDLDYWYDDFKNFSRKDGGVVGGVRAGYDARVGNGILVGVLGEFSLTDLDTVGAVKPDEDTYEIGATVKRLGSVRAKLGYASGNLAVYGTVGLGFANIKHHMADIDGSDESFNRKGDRSGIVYGVGAALNVSGRSNVGFELSQYDFGSRTHEVLESDGGSTDYFFKQDDRVRTATVNYTYGF